MGLKLTNSRLCDHNVWSAIAHIVNSAWISPRMTLSFRRRGKRNQAAQRQNRENLEAGRRGLYRADFLVDWSFNSTVLLVFSPFGSKVLQSIRQPDT